MLAAAAALRVVTMLGYRPPMLYWYDSFTYLNVAMHLRPAAPYQPGGFQPAGYPFLLWTLWPFHSVLLVAAVQHLMGLAVGAMVYAVLRRRSVPGWGATLAAVPGLFDASFLRLEHALLPDTLFVFLVAAALTVALWPGAAPCPATPSPRTAAVAAALLAAATLVRSVGLPLLVVFAAYLVLRRAGRRTVVAALLAGALPLVAYASWFRAEEGRFGLAGGDGVALWARTMTFANCDAVKPPPELRDLCPNATRLDAAGDYLWDQGAAINRAPGGLAANNDRARSFALHVMAAQPLDYAGNVVRDTALTFAFPPARHPRRVNPAFGFAEGCRGPLPGGEPQIVEARKRYDKAIRAQCSVDPYARFLVGYQYPAYLPGPLLGVILLAGLAGVARRRYTALLPWSFAVLLLVVPVALLDFDHRYVLPVVPFACAAAALGLTGLRAVRPAPARPYD